MTKLTVELGERSYPIVIGSGALSNRDWWLAQSGHASTVAIVTNETVAPLYAETLREALERPGRRLVTVILPDGEEHKTWPTLNMIYDALLEARCDRDTLIVALGGGVVGDLAGFAAATYQRGIGLIQVPTTLLSQVDSSVGGKTGVNHPSGKNMIGAFYQPRAVCIDIDTLETLAAREFSAGLAEIIKHGAACDLEYFHWLEANFDLLLARDPAILCATIARSCEIKARIVSADEREAGQRAILNFGHTFGHAIETGLGYGQWLHGEAVAAGMCLAGQLSVNLGLLTSADARRLEELVLRARLPIQAPPFDTARWHELMARDKKAAEGRPRFIVLRSLGDAAVVDVAPSELERLLDSAKEAGARRGYAP